ncbi:MAG: hypothetical protein Q7O66_23695, partial [Dehalococcoidia bacterium]|nr:hypothetical protein [Dehalococcoidia bacterium]
MTRVDDLQRKYTTIPREIIIKMEALTHGVRDSEGLDKASFWSRAGEIGTYQSYDRHADYAEVVAKRQKDTKPGFVKRLGSFYLKNGAGARMERDHTSPYEIRELGPGQFALFEGEEKVENIYFPELPFPYQKGQEPLTSRGNPVTTVINMRSPYCHVIAPVRHCEYFNTGEQCKYCNFNHTQEQARSVGANRTATVNLDETAEAYKIVSSDVKFLEGAFLMGSFKDPDQTAKVQLDFIEKIGRSASYKVDIGAVIQPMTLKNMQRMKDCGVDRIYYSMEVWDRDLFGEVCPGKNKHTGYDRYLEAQLEAVDVFGAGRVTTAFVGGVTLMPPNGHKTWQEA